jgi:acetyltransferase-like isoleucine patch superfamily enzyme
MRAEQAWLREATGQSDDACHGDGAFLGEGCVILKGVRVGKRAVVAANAVVTRDVPDFAVVAGVPAKVVKSVSPAMGV